MLNSKETATKSVVLGQPQSDRLQQVMATYPGLKAFKIKKNGKYVVIRAKYGKRSLFTCSPTIEVATMYFINEFLTKVINFQFMEKTNDIFKNLTPNFTV